MLPRSPSSVLTLTWRRCPPSQLSHLYTVYSLGGDEDGSLRFLFPKFPFQRTESLRTTMADRAGSLVGWTLDLRSASTCFQTVSSQLWTL